MMEDPIKASRFSDDIWWFYVVYQTQNLSDTQQYDPLIRGIIKLIGQNRVTDAQSRLFTEWVEATIEAGRFSMLLNITRKWFPVPVFGILADKLKDGMDNAVSSLVNAFQPAEDEDAQLQQIRDVVLRGKVRERLANRQPLRGRRPSVRGGK